jgi:hypothetical protein
MLLLSLLRIRGAASDAGENKATSGALVLSPVSSSTDVTPQAHPRRASLPREFASDGPADLSGDFSLHTAPDAAAPSNLPQLSTPDASHQRSAVRTPESSPSAWLESPLRHSSAPVHGVDQDSIDDAEAKLHRDLVVVVISSTLLVIVSVVAVMLYCKQKIDEEQNAEYTRPIPGDGAFEFSQLGPA